MNRLSMVRGGFLPVSLLLAIAGVGCGGDNNNSVDMGRDVGSPDLGDPADLGQQDEGVDQGSAAMPQVRVVHAVSDLLTANDVPIEGIRLCVDIPGLGVIAQPANADLLEEYDLTRGLPFRAVTPYLDTLPESTVRVYDEAAVDNDTVGAPPPAVNCPATGLDADCTDDAVPCLFQFDFDPTSLENGSSYSLIVDGFVDNTNTCVGGTIACPTGAVGASIEQDEDADDVVAGSARVRFFHGVHNLPNVDVCYDLDGLAGSAAAPTVIHANVATGALTGYVTVPPVTTGFVFLTVKNPLDASTLLGDCALSTTAAASGLPSNVVPVFFSPANAMAMPPDTTPNVAAGTVLTIFATGDVRFGTAPTETPQMDPVGWANYVGRTPVPFAFFEVAPAAP